MTTTKFIRSFKIEKVMLILCIDAWSDKKIKEKKISLPDNGLPQRK